MTQLTLTKNHFIVFHDRTKIEVTEKQADKVMEASGTTAKFIRLQGRLINFSSIAQIIPTDEYYKSNPEKRTENAEYLKPFPNYKGFEKTYLNTEKRLKKMLEIWKKQYNHLENGGNGGLMGLIEFGEKKLSELNK